MRKTGLAVALVAVLLPAVPAAALPTPVPSPTDSVPSPTPSPTTSPTKAPRPHLDRKPVTVSVTPSSGKVGVGQLITATFSSPVRFKAKAETAMTVSADPGESLPDGSWAWIDSRTAIYRPRDFWPGKTRIWVDLSLRRVPLNREGDTQWVGARSTTRREHFRTARSFVARIDAKTHQMRVYRQGVLVKVFGVSLGKAGFRTRSGVKVITGEKYRWQRMTSQELGLVNESYDLQVPYAVRLTPTGEFVHGAPWAEYRIGRYNGSHGCTNLGVAESRWFYNHVQPGDVTITTRTGRRMETTNGVPGSYWNYPWRQWREMSALR